MDELSKVEFLERENKLLFSQQSNYKELTKVLTERHVEILKYLNHLKTYVEKVLSISKENVMFSAYLNDKGAHEGNIVKFDRQIQSLTELIQSSQAKISDNEENLFKEQLKLLSTTLDPSLYSSTVEPNPLPLIASFAKYRCDHYDCSEEFTSKHHLEAHLRAHHHANAMASFGSSIESGSMVQDFEKKDIENAKIKEEFIFVPQMELEVLEYSSSSSPYGSNSQSNHLDSGTAPRDNGSYSLKKLARCDICNKYFNKHYLESHKRTHSGEKPYTCSINGCNRQFTQSSSRNFHEKRFHRNTKYNCIKCSLDTCQLTFDSNQAMQEHYQQHLAMIDGDRQQSFKVEHGMEPLLGPHQPQQQQVLHQQQPMYATSSNGKVKAGSNRGKSNGSDCCALKHVCTECGKSFAYKMALKQHSLMHGDKNFRCSFCSYSSYWSHNLKLHMRKHQVAAATPPLPGQ